MFGQWRDTSYLHRHADLALWLDRQTLHLRRVAMVAVSGAALYYAEDMLGSSRVMVQANGTLCYDADFTPFGAERTYVSTCAPNYKFEGKERDAETQNDDFGAREYCWRFGRWLSADWSAVPVAVPYANLTNPQTLNLYAMVADDPESFADLDGHGTIAEGGEPVVVPAGTAVCPSASAKCPPPVQDTPPAQMSSLQFLGAEVKGVWDVTGGALYDLGKSVLNGDAEKNIATTAEWAVTSPGANNPPFQVEYGNDPKP